MKAKETKVIQEEILRKYPGTDPEIDIDWDIVEISFKAGMKVAADWISENAPLYNCGECGYVQHIDDDWQAKLKEWGINADS